MAAEGIQLDAGLFDTLLSAYVRQAEDTLRFYAADAAINGLTFGRARRGNGRGDLRAAASAPPPGRSSTTRWGRR